MGNMKTKNILFFAPCWPAFDKNAGGKRMYEILKILSSKYNVYFITNNYYNKKYAKILKDLNINAHCKKPIPDPVSICTPDIDKSKSFNGFPFCYSKMYIYQYLLHIKHINFEFCFFAWYTSAIDFSHMVKKIFPNIKTIVDSVDVHWLREERSNTSNFCRKEYEKNVYESCDTVIAVSNSDREVIEKECNIENIKVIPTLHEEKIKHHSNGEDILFIGGFNHSPNIIAAIRAAKIYKQFTFESRKNCKLYIIGNKPTKHIKSLHDNNIIVTDYVSDSDMTEYFKKAKVLLAPLTYGAGIKGKICEAIMHKVPVITTSIGIEGFDLNNFEDYFCAETDREFIGALKNIYNLDKNIIKEITNRAFQKTQRMLSLNSAASTLDFILNPDRHVVISIITYKNQELLKKCLQSIIEHTTYKNLTLVITDNAAEEHTKDIVTEFIKNNNIDIIYYANEQNDYFSKPNNKVIQEFYESDIILLNDDTIIKTNNWIQILQNTAYMSGDIGCCGGKAINPDNTISEAGSCIYNDGTAQNIGYNEDIDSKRYNKKLFVGYCAGSLLYMKREAINDIGILDENFKPLYYEDVDWQIRCHLIGYKTVYEPKCVYEHKLSATVSKLSNKNHYLENAKNIFCQKYMNHDLEQYNHENKWNPNSEWMKYRE